MGRTKSLMSQLSRCLPTGQLGSFFATFKDCKNYENLLVDAKTAVTMASHTVDGAAKK
jgi:hypothetical protein